MKIHAPMVSLLFCILQKFIVNFNEHRKIYLLNAVLICFQSQHFGGRSAVNTNGGPDVERELERLVS